MTSNTTSLSSLLAAPSHRIQTVCVSPVSPRPSSSGPKVFHPGSPSTVHELMNNDFTALTQADMEDIRTAVASALLAPDMSARWCFMAPTPWKRRPFSSTSPVIFTGAQRSRHHQDPDGPG